MIVSSRDARRRGATPLYLLVPALAAAAVALLPLVYLFVRSTERGIDPVVDELRRPQTLDLLQRSVWLAGTVTALAVVVGVAAAWVVAATDVPGRRVLEVVFALPLAIPTYVAAYTWVSNFPRFEGFRGSTTVLVACCYPYVYVPVLAALRRLDPDLVDVARSLGCSPGRAFLRVTLPQIRPAATTGALLVALYALSDFGAVSLMRFEAFTQAIYLSYAGSFDRTPAAVLGCVLVALTTLIVVAEIRARGHAAAAVASARRAHRPAAPVPLGPLRIPVLAAAGGVVAVAVGLPLWTLARWFLRANERGVPWAELRRAAWSTAHVSVLGAVVAVALALPVGILAVRHRSRTATAIEGATYVGHALPGIVVALALVFFGIRYATSLYQRLPLLVGAYVVLFLPLAVGAVRASVAQASPRLEEVARSLGSRPLAVLARVTVPLAAPGIAAGAALVALTCLKELPATLLLRPNAFETLATRVWTETSVADYGRAAPYALVIVLLGIAPMLVVSRTGRAPDASAASVAQ